MIFGYGITTSTTFCNEINYELRGNEAHTNLHQPSTMQKFFEYF